MTHRPRAGARAIGAVFFDIRRIMKKEKVTSPFSSATPDFSRINCRFYGRENRIDKNGYLYRLIFQ